MTSKEANSAVLSFRWELVGGWKMANKKMREMGKRIWQKWRFVREGGQEPGGYEKCISKHSSCIDGEGALHVEDTISISSLI